MASKNSQILLIENVLSNLNEDIGEKEHLIKAYENETDKLKKTISTLKHECKTAFNEQERLEDIISDLKKQIDLVQEELKRKEDQLISKAKDFDALKVQNKQFMDNVEKRTREFKEELEDKNLIISELENINKELNNQIYNVKKEDKKKVSKLERKLEQEEFKNFINSKNSYDFSPSIRDNEVTKLRDTIKSKPNPTLKLSLLEEKLKNSKKEKDSLNKDSQSEEDIIRKNLGF